MSLPEIIGGKYRPQSVLGSGATGTVYSVVHTTTCELRALKVMNAHLGASADAIARFKREARAASKIRSQHVVHIYDADVAPELGGVPYLVMDLLVGSDLEQACANKRVASEDLVEWFRQIALGVDKAHRLGIIHRDLKPENLFLTRLDDGTALVKILDFGTAKIISESPNTTQSGQVFGTPLYMAPEQARGNPLQVGPATDLYALGQIAYKLLTGVAYRKGSSVTELLEEVLNEPLEPPSRRGQSLGDAFDRWFLRACDPNPAQRFRTAHEQVEALAVALGLPGEPEVTMVQPSSVGPWSSTSQPSMSLPPGSIAAGLGGLHATAAAMRVMGGEEGIRMPINSVSDDPARMDFGRKAALRRALFMGSGLVAVCAVAVAVWMSRTPSGGLTPASVVPRGSGCPIDLPIPTVAAEDLPHAATPSTSAPPIVSAAWPNPAAVAPASSSTATFRPVVGAPAIVAPPTLAARVPEPQPQGASYLATPVMSRHEVDHSVPARANPPSLVGIVTSHRSAPDDGPLSDQK